MGKVRVRCWVIGAKEEFTDLGLDAVAANDYFEVLMDECLLHREC